MQNYPDREFADGYYDGIPEYIKNMSPEELDKFIEEEKRKSERENQHR